MIKSIKITNHLDESITLTLKNPEQSGFFIRKIDGLEPPPATVNIDQFLTDGGIYSSSRINSRNVIFDIGFYNAMPSTSIEALRILSYKYFPVNKRIKITVTTDSLISYTYGYVESNDVPIFAKEEGAIISVQCPEQYFVGLDEFSIPMTGAGGDFEFPLENEGLTPAIVLGHLYDDVNTAYVNYSGTYETGVVLTAVMSGSVSGLYFVENSKNQRIDIDSDKVLDITGSGIVDGDTIVISTKQNAKFAKLLRGSAEYNILAALFTDGTIDWITFVPGDNYIKFGADSGVDNVIASCGFNLLYGGV